MRLSSCTAHGHGHMPHGVPLSQAEEHVESGVTASAERGKCNGGHRGAGGASSAGGGHHRGHFATTSGFAVEFFPPHREDTEEGRLLSRASVGQSIGHSMRRKAQERVPSLIPPPRQPDQPGDQAVYGADPTTNGACCGAKISKLKLHANGGSCIQNVQNGDCRGNAAPVPRSSGLSPLQRGKNTPYFNRKFQNLRLKLDQKTTQRRFPAAIIWAPE